MANLADTENQYPTTKYQILKLMNSNINVDYYSKCNDCKQYKKVGPNKRAFCATCRSSSDYCNTDFFVYIDISTQIEAEVKNNWHDIYTYYRDVHRCELSKAGDMKDVYSSEIFKDAYNKMSPNEFLLPLCLNTDGVQPFKSTAGFSFWPIFLMQLYMKPGQRYSNNHMLLVGLYYGETKPDMEQFLTPLVQQFTNYHINKMEIVLNNRTVKFEPRIITCSVDLPAKAAVQNMMQYNGKFGCGYCTHPGQSVEVGKVKGTKQVRFGRLKNVSSRRLQHDKTAKIMNRIGAKSKPQIGIKGKSILLNLPNFDIVDGFVIDYLHNILQGVVRLLFRMWFECKRTNGRRNKFYITETQQKILNSRIRNIKSCRFINRKARPLSARKKFKANEIRGMLLYYLPICLLGIMPKEYLDHFMLLSGSTFILLQKTITDADLNTAQMNLRIFVHNFEKLYKIKNMTNNVHLLSHLVDCVRRTGPLWSQSTFHFENWNGVLSKFINGPTDIVPQILLKYLMRKNVPRTSTPSSQGNSSYLLGNPVEINIDEDMSALESLGKFSLGKKINVWKRFKIHNSIYTSQIYTRAKKSRDYVVLINGDRCGIVKYFFRHKNQILAVLIEFKKIKQFQQFWEVESSNAAIVKAEDIAGKYIYLTKGSKFLNNYREFIVIEPNPYERE